MRLLAQATDRKIEEKFGLDNKWGDIIRSVLGVVGTMLIAFNVGDITMLEWEQFTQIFMVVIGGVLDIISISSSWFNSEE